MFKNIMMSNRGVLTELLPSLSESVWEHFSEGEATIEDGS